MPKIARALIRFLLPRILANSCPATIPRSGADGERVNCYITAVDDGGNPYLILTSVKNGHISALEFDGHRYTIERTIAIDDIAPSALRVSHNYGLASVTYDGVWDLARGYFFRLPYVGIRLYWAREAVAQHIFNRRTLVVKHRLEVLQEVVEMAEKGHPSIDAMAVMNERYGARWAGHSGWGNHDQTITFYLNGLVDTGDLTKVNNTYQPTGFAIKTLEEAGEQDRRHASNIRVQALLCVLAAVSALLAAVQAGLIKLPALFDLTLKGSI